MTLRWPWVSRAVADVIERRRASEAAILEKRAEELRVDLLRERVRTAKLTAALIRMKRDGAVLLPAQTLRMERREPTAIEKAVDRNARARHDTALRRHLLKYGEDQRALGRDEESIAEEIEHWNAVTHDDDDEDDDTL